VDELELKFQVPAERVAAVEQALKRGRAKRRQLRARYFDTPESALEHADIVLRLRQEGNEWVQTAKGPGRGGFERLEHNADVATGDADALPDISRHDGHPLRGMLAAALGPSAPNLRPVFETDVTRLTREITVSGSTIEVALDRGHIRGDGWSHPVTELEFELKEGSPSSIFELAGTWCENHGLWLDPLSKSELGQRLARGVRQPEPVTAPDVPESGRKLLAAIVDAGLRQVLSNARELVAGTGGDEHVHQLRVGIRRIRTALRELDEAGGWDDHTQADATLSSLFRVLGEHRDQSTLLPEILQQLSAASAPVQAWEPVLPDLPAAIRDPAVQNAFLWLAALAQTLREGEGVRRKTLRALARDRLQSLHRKMVKAGKRFDELPMPQRHQVRKRLKRLRYLAELVRPLFSASAVDDYVGSLKALQDALGRYQDATAARALFEQRAASDPAAWFGAGWLAARDEVLACECTQACRRAAHKAKPFWT
jgi:triphosphatase